MVKGIEDVAALIDGFFSSERLRPVLKSLLRRDVSGWEVWLQIEFAHYLTTMDGDQNWYREYEITSTDNEKKSRPDFWLWSKHDKKYTLLEFKQANDSKMLLSSMVKDTLKSVSSNMVCSSDNEIYEFSRLFFIGIFKGRETKPLHLVDCIAEKTSIEIPDTGYSYVVFSHDLAPT
jgi:hypothetical protein